MRTDRDSALTLIFETLQRYATRRRTRFLPACCAYCGLRPWDVSGTAAGRGTLCAACETLRQRLADRNQPCADVTRAREEMIDAHAEEAREWLPYKD